MAAGVIRHGYARLIELQTEYSYPDMLDLYEVMMVRLHNEWVIQDEAEKRARRPRC